MINISTTQSGIDMNELSAYITKQIEFFFPDKENNIMECIQKDIEQAIERFFYCIHHVKMWRGTGFHHLHSEKNAIFLYYLANTIWKNRQNKRLCEKLFYLNKSLNGFHCFYDTELPDIFFIGHSVGIVLVRTYYSNYLVLYQGVTVGKNHNIAPILEEGVVLYPGSAVIGNCQIRHRSFISQNTSVINQSTPENSIIFSNHGKLIYKKPKHDILSDFFYL
jgi:serine O-acetyltransferase